MLNLNDKERMLLQDEKAGEELCIEKYKKYSEEASDPELKKLFKELMSKEEDHLKTLNQMLTGTVPTLNTQQKQQNQQNSNTNVSSANVDNKNQINFKQDKIICQDSLAGEKYVSSTYNSTIFEMRDTNARQVLNHIQKEEQEHGEKIYNYMQSHNMYN
ncbi:Spore coat protein [Sarcina ventriculi]|uniref:spore coat protein n=1 Tax=Sarcina ventriculi TaxID=1267 RepID=UPI000D8210B7|nr:spore coat protein [Sarcina ventriculi]SPZ49031.1 Spore coat protein [Sarcina ventriculi]